jgi:hypothetical protein
LDWAFAKKGGKTPRRCMAGLVEKALTSDFNERFGFFLIGLERS